MGNVRNDNGDKMKVNEVCSALAQTINAEQANVLFARYNEELHPTPKVRFAHMVLDAYKHLPSTTEQDMLVKKLAKHLMEKYMKSATAEDGDRDAYINLINVVKEKAETVQ